MAHISYLAKVTSAIGLLPIIVYALPLFDPSQGEICGPGPDEATGVPPEASLYIAECP